MQTEPSSAASPVLVFDWGNTLMKVLPQYSGPMANWPEVAEVDGIVEALEAMLGRSHMAVATNASDSNAEQVWKALRRAGLGEYFKAVFTSRELGSHKPEPRFFRQIESVLARPAHQIVMVGDDFRVDVLGAKAVGWKAIWYNPTHLAAPGLIPFHDAEIDDMRQLPQAVQHLTLPGHAECLAWLVDRGTPYNILAHLQLVAAVAYQLAVWLRGAGRAVDPVLTHRAALLHDLAKMDSVRLRKERGLDGDHAAMAAELLYARDQPELARIADRHMPYQDPQDPRRPQTWEEKLVHFADKLSEGSVLVSLEERLTALKGRYPQYAAELEDSLPTLTALQAEICAPLGWDSEELLLQLRLSLGLKAL